MEAGVNPESTNLVNLITSRSDGIHRAVNRFCPPKPLQTILLIILYPNST
jgi:hypothetical protein